MKVHTWLLFLIIVALVGGLVFTHRAVYFSPVIDKAYAEKYGASQYVLGEKSQAKIDDSTLYTYAAIAYMRGEDPTTINFEHPPFGKYVYGVFYTFFNNTFVANIFIFSALLLVYFALSQFLIKNYWLQLLALFLFGTLGILHSHAQYSLLDMPFLLGSLCLLLVLFKRPTSWWQFGALGVLFGLTASIKYPFPTMVLFLAIILWWAWQEKQLQKYVASVAIGGVTYLATYTVYFIHGHSLMDFINFEKYRLSWFGGKTDSPKLLIYSTLFTGRYKEWWSDGYEVARTWSILWPLSLIVSLCTTVWYRRSSKEVWTIFFVSFGFLVLFSIGAAASDRFFIQLVPYWLLLSFHGIEQGMLKRKLKVKHT